MELSLVICTRDRAALIRRTLESLRSLVIPRALRWEIVVVNNASTDDTGSVLASIEGLPVRVVNEPVAGASRSRNTGVAASHGDLLLFTDDDVQVDPGWVKAYLEATARWPDALFFAGRIDPDFSSDVPRWVRRNAGPLRGMLCALDLGDAERPLEAGECPWGPNMAVRRRAFDLARFDVDMGRIGTGQLRGSEDSLFRPLVRQGGSGVWVPAARVRHYVPRERATATYLVRYYAGTGRASAALNYPAVPTLRRQGLLLARSLTTLVRRPAQWPRPLADVVWGISRMAETRRQRARHLKSAAVHEGRHA